MAGLQRRTLSQTHKVGAAHNSLAVSGHFRPRQGTFRPEHNRGKYRITGLKCLSSLTRFPNAARPGYAPCRAAFFLPHTQFSAMVPEKRTNKTAHSLAANDTAFSRKRGGFFVAGWGLCYTQPHPARRLTPSGLQRAFGAALLTLSEMRQKL